MGGTCEAERRTVGKLAKDYQDRDVHYFYSGEKRYPSAGMNFSVSNGIPSGMALFCLLYPSKFLSDCYDPIACMNECLAIRQNVAKRYGNIQFQTDVWDERFEEASRKEKIGGSSDLIPFWGLRETDDMVKIERIVPMYPFSRDGLAYERLIKILSMYRLMLGQARQEELLEYLFKNCDDPDRLKELFINLSPFYKEHRAGE